MFINLDSFGREVRFTWKGKEEFKTTFGATMTVLLITVLVGYSFSNFNEVLNRLNPMVSSTTLLREAASD